MQTIPSSLPPIGPGTGAGTSAGKAEPGSAGDFLSLVVEAADQEPASPLESESAAPAPAQTSAEPVIETEETTLAPEMALPTVALPTGLIDGAAGMPAAPVNAAPSDPATADTPTPETTQLKAALAKTAKDLLLAAQAPQPTQASDATLPLLPDEAAAIPFEPEAQKPAKDQPATLPGSQLSMNETAEGGLEILPAALAFRKALDQRTGGERALGERGPESSVDAPRSDPNAPMRTDTRAANELSAAIRLNAQADPAGANEPSTGTASPLETALRHPGEDMLDPLLGTKTGEAKPSHFTNALMLVKGVPVNPQAVVGQVAVQLTAAGKAKTQALTVKLEPVELGKIDIRLDFGSDGKVQASIFADRPQTLDMLQRDARGLEKALQNAGLQTDSGSLSFNLRGQDRENASADGERRFAFGESAEDGKLGGEPLTVLSGQARSLAAAGRVDLLL